MIFLKCQPVCTFARFVACILGDEKIIKDDFKDTRTPGTNGLEVGLSGSKNCMNGI